MLVPLLKLVWDRDPLAPETLRERATVVRERLRYGVTRPTAGGGLSW